MVRSKKQELERHFRIVKSVDGAVSESCVGCVVLVLLLVYRSDMVLAPYFLITALFGSNIY